MQIEKQGITSQYKENSFFYSDGWQTLKYIPWRSCGASILGEALNSTVSIVDKHLHFYRLTRFLEMLQMYLSRPVLHHGGCLGSSEEFSSDIYKSFLTTILLTLFLRKSQVYWSKCFWSNFLTTSLISNLYVYSTKYFREDVVQH